MSELRVFSYGGGVQSNAVLVLQVQGKLAQPYDAFVFANVGSDSENRDTLAYIERYAKPYAAANGIRFIEVQKQRRDGTKVTLRAELERVKRSIIIPARIPGKGFGNRNCTTGFKIRVIDRYIKQQRVSHGIVGLGISWDESERMRSTAWHDRETENPNSRKLGFSKRRDYPLIDLRMTRDQCAAAVVRAGLPLPPKSSCSFCPFKRANEWIELKRTQPDVFEDAVEVERIINQKRVDIGRDGMFLHPSCKPLAYAVSDQLPLFEFEDTCESGYCMT